MKPVMEFARYTRVIAQRQNVSILDCSFLSILSAVGLFEPSSALFRMSHENFLSLETSHIS